MPPSLNLSSFLRAGAGLTGVVISGEAFALLVGMHLLSGRGNTWPSFKNDFLLGVDFVTGACLIYLAATNALLRPSNLLNLVLAVALLAHGYREGEYWLHLANKFCANPPLFVVNNVKLVGLLVISSIALGVKSGWF